MLHARVEASIAARAKEGVNLVDSRPRKAWGG